MLFMSMKIGWVIAFAVIVSLLVCFYYCCYIGKKKSIDEKLVECLKPSIKYFSGSMNALMAVAKDPDFTFADNTFTNISQIVSIKCDEKVKEWYSVLEKDRIAWNLSQYSKKAQEVLIILKKCGVQSYKESVINWGNSYSAKYNKLKAVSDGQECEVVDPYWLYNGQVFEKGLVRPK